MQTLAPDVKSNTSTAAQRLADQYWQSNSQALCSTQPLVAAVLNQVHLDVEWVFARDGSLSALENGRWWADCSVPLLAGRTHLRTLADEPVGSCQLVPTHAGLVRASRERMGNVPVLFIVQPDQRIARMILSCDDFSQQIAQHRFWMAAGAAWLAHLEQMFTDHPGLATPLRFIRTRLTAEEATAAMITDIQAVFSRVLSSRSAQVTRLQAEPLLRISPRTILLVGGTEFRLWDFGTQIIGQQLMDWQASHGPSIYSSPDLPLQRQVLAAKAASPAGTHPTLEAPLDDRSITDGLTIRRFDMDDALLGSPLALLRASRECGSVVAADVCRADCNQLLSPQIPWLTWLTRPGAPPFETAGPRDALILADEQWRPIARAAGWPMQRVRVCGWPVNIAEPSAAVLPPGGERLGLICDTRKLRIPTSVADFSSHRLLWELIEEELSANPLAVEDVDGYLTNRASQLNIAVDVLDRPRFVDELILPAYQQGLARMLISVSVPLRLWGKGWGDLPEFSQHVAGAISSAIDFEQAIQSCRGLIYAWPTRCAHAIETTGKPVVYRNGSDRAAFIRAAKRIAAGLNHKPISTSEAGRMARAIMDSLAMT